MSTWRPQEAASLVIDICRFTSDTLQTFSFRIGTVSFQLCSGQVRVWFVLSHS